MLSVRPMLKDTGMVKGRASAWLSWGIACGLGPREDKGWLATGDSPMGKASGTSRPSDTKRRKINEAGLRHLLSMTDERFS